MNLVTELHVVQNERWPQAGRHILAQFDEDSIVVYQAFKPSIGELAAKHGHFGGELNFGRMSWIKPNFLWMMFRSGWGTKENQEVTLAVRLERSAFDTILAQAVPSSFGAARRAFASEEAWKAAIETSSVRLQWDPDHHPSGAPLERRAIQLGLRGEVLRRYAHEWLLGVEDISELVREQRAHVEARAYDRLVTPRERVYPVSDARTRARLGLDTDSPGPS